MNRLLWIIVGAIVSALVFLAFLQRESIVTILTTSFWQGEDETDIVDYSKPISTLSFKLNDQSESWVSYPAHPRREISGKKNDKAVVAKHPFYCIWIPFKYVRGTKEKKLKSKVVYLKCKYTMGAIVRDLSKGIAHVSLMRRNNVAMETRWLFADGQYKLTHINLRGAIDGKKFNEKYILADGIKTELTHSSLTVARRPKARAKFSISGKFQIDLSGGKAPFVFEVKGKAIQIPKWM